jgi:membrane protein YdbS with pleckstrin-like domain
MRNDNSLTVFLLRAWMWLVPAAMLVAAVVFGVIAAADGNWGLLVVMAAIGVFACVLMVAHYWLLYRFGKGAGE